MSKIIGDRLPNDVLDALNGVELETKLGSAYLLVTTDADGTPRPCMLSAGEVLAPDPHTLRFALWSGSHTSQNLARGARTLFCHVAPGTVIYVKGRARPLPDAERAGLACFELEVGSVESDDHPGMPVTSGITFGLEQGNAAEVIDAWREQLAALRG